MSRSISDFGQNTWLVEEMYQQFKEDPNSVDPSWHDLLKNYEPGDNGSGSDSAPETQSNGSNGSAPEKKPAAQTSPTEKSPTEQSPAKKSTPAPQKSATKAQAGAETGPARTGPGA